MEYVEGGEWWGGEGGMKYLGKIRKLKRGIWTRLLSSVEIFVEHLLRNISTYFVL